MCGSDSMRAVSESEFRFNINNYLESEIKALRNRQGGLKSRLFLCVKNKDFQFRSFKPVHKR